jgi:hypothetical protein
LRVVCALGVTIASFWPTNRLSKVDLPALGAPISATKPHRIGFSCSSSTDSSSVLFRPLDDLGVGPEPYVAARLGMADDFVEDPNA